MRGKVASVKIRKDHDIQRAEFMRVRIEDVAEAAGVSMKTVSRVLNHEPNVSDATRKRVEAA